MERRPLVMNKGNMIGWTERSRAFVRDQLERAKRLTEDTFKKERLAEQNCKCCFYGSRIGGAAMTTQPCMCCHKPVMYGSTATDALCMDCARENELCKRCGGDIELRTRRKDWPTAKVDV